MRTRLQSRRTENLGTFCHERLFQPGTRQQPWETSESQSCSVSKWCLLHSKQIRPTHSSEQRSKWVSLKVQCISLWTEWFSQFSKQGCLQKLLSCHFQCTYPSLSQPADMLVLTACYRYANVDMTVTYLSQSIWATLSPHTSHIQELGRGGNDNLMNSSWDLKFCLVRSRYTTRYLDSEARRLKDACLTVLLPGCCYYYRSFLFLVFWGHLYLGQTCRRFQRGDLFQSQECSRQKEVSTTNCTSSSWKNQSLGPTLLPCPALPATPTPFPSRGCPRL